MIPREDFYERRAVCAACPFWRGVCLKGHALGSAQGCPLRKFPPLAGADYAPDKPLSQESPQLAGCCGGKPDMPPLTWPEVLKHFAVSMAKWVREGFPLVNVKEHGLRYGKCKTCVRFAGFYCLDCRCISLVKTKLLTEKCPRDKW